MRVLLCFKEKFAFFKSCPFFSNTSAEGRYIGEPRAVLAWALLAYAEQLTDVLSRANTEWTRVALGCFQS